MNRVAAKLVPCLITEQQKEISVNIQKLMTEDKSGFVATTLRKQFNHHMIWQMTSKKKHDCVLL